MTLRLSVSVISSSCLASLSKQSRCNAFREVTEAGITVGVTLSSVRKTVPAHQRAGESPRDRGSTWSFFRKCAKRREMAPFGVGTTLGYLLQFST